jgi:hypothetical protein
MLVVVTIPIYKSCPNPFERVSLKQALKVLGKFPMRFVMPHGLDDSYYKKVTEEVPNVNFVKFEKSYFQGIDGYNKLMLNVEFYRTFLEYKYMLIYQLDAFVFKDSLLEWVEKGYSNIGAPWLKRTKVGYKFITPTGNGGLVLRNIADCLRVLENKKIVFTPFLEFILFKDLEYKIIRRYKKLILNQIKTPFLSLDKYLASFPYNEDIFWAKVAPLVDKGYSTAPPFKAMQFAFDQHADVLFKWNNKKIPFGCHGWSKPEYLKFWQPIIERQVGKL